MEACRFKGECRCSGLRAGRRSGGGAKAFGQHETGESPPTPKGLSTLEYNAAGDEYPSVDREKQRVTHGSSLGNSKRPRRRGCMNRR